MEDLLVLGIVPNTNIQINFEGWLMLVQSVLLLFLLVYRVRNVVGSWYKRHLETRAVRSLIEYHSL